MSILLTIVTQWYYHSLVSEDASVSSLPHPRHLTRHRAPFYLQNISQLRLDIPIPAAQLEAVMVAQQSWLSHEWTADTLLSVPISYCPLHSCQIDLRKTQPGSAHTLLPDIQFFTVVTESTLFSFPFLECSPFTTWFFSPVACSLSCQPMRNWGALRLPERGGRVTLYFSSVVSMSP